MLNVQPLSLTTHVTARFFRYFIFNYCMCAYICLYVIIYPWVYFSGFSVRMAFWSFGEQG